MIIRLMRLTRDLWFSHDSYQTHEAHMWLVILTWFLSDSWGSHVTCDSHMILIRLVRLMCDLWFSHDSYQTHEAHAWLVILTWFLSDSWGSHVTCDSHVILIRLMRLTRDLWFSHHTHSILHLLFLYRWFVTLRSSIFLTSLQSVPTTLRRKTWCTKGLLWLTLAHRNCLSTSLMHSSLLVR